MPQASKQRRGAATGHGDGELPWRAATPRPMAAARATAVTRGASPRQRQGRRRERGGGPGCRLGGGSASGYRTGSPAAASARSCGTRPAWSPSSTPARWKASSRQGPGPARSRARSTASGSWTSRSRRCSTSASPRPAPTAPSRCYPAGLRARNQLSSRMNCFSASMRNHITWSDNGEEEPCLDIDANLEVSLEVYTKPFSLLPLSAVEKPGNLLMQGLLDRLVPKLGERLLRDYHSWVQRQSEASETER